jgi:hypothetical protein
VKKAQSVRYLLLNFVSSCSCNKLIAPAAAKEAVNRIFSASDAVIWPKIDVTNFLVLVDPGAEEADTSVDGGEGNIAA